MALGAKFRQLNLIVLVIAVSFGVGLDQLLRDSGVESDLLKLSVSVLSSGAIYLLSLQAAFFVLAHSNFVLRLYWG